MSARGRVSPVHAERIAVLHSLLDELPVEAEYIERETGHKRLTRPLEAQDFHGQPCPFLTEGRCGIYKARPISCRMHVAFTTTAYWRSSDRALTDKFQRVDLTGVKEALVYLAEAHGNLVYVDIRQIFKPKH